MRHTKDKDRGIYIMELENAVQLCTKPELYEYLIRVAKAPRKYGSFRYLAGNLYLL